MPVIYMMMCDECFGHVKIGDTFEVDARMGQHDGYNKPCEMCGKGIQSATVRCSLIERDGDKLKLKVEGAMKVW